MILNNIHVKSTVYSCILNINPNLFSLNSYKMCINDFIIQL